MQIEQDNNIVFNDNKKAGDGKTTKIIIALIVVTIVAVIGILYAILVMLGKGLTVVIDGKKVNVSEDTFIFQDNGDIYVSITDIAPLVGYEPHNGEYKIDIEDPNKLYVQSANGTETTSFFLNSDIISKVAPDSNDDYENITIDKAIFREDSNNKLYITSKGFIIAFNSLFEYNKQTNMITIQTLPSLIKKYSEEIKTIGSKQGYSRLSENFNAQKALVYGLIVASRDSDGKFGVINTQGTEILSPRYNNIEFIESSKEFIVTNSSNKVGIAFITGNPKITVSWDEIKVLDSSKGLYLVKSNNKYGVINSSESPVIHTEYDQIGVDTSQFPADNIQNQYILENEIIPAKINGKWILLDTKGQKIIEDEYDDIGFINKNLKDSTINNAVAIKDTGTVIVRKGDIYGGVDVRGNELIQIRYESIYSRTIDGKTTYYIFYNGLEYNAVEFIDLMKERLGYNKVEEPEEPTDERPGGITDEEGQAVNNVVDRVDRADANTANTSNMAQNTNQVSN